MNKYLILLAIITFGGCEFVSTQKISEEHFKSNKEQYDKLHGVLRGDTSAIRADSANTTFQKRTVEFNCDLAYYMQDSTIPEFAKSLYNQTYMYANDNEPLDLFDSLDNTDTEKKKFYFRAITNSYEIADGAFAEGLMLSVKEYVEEHTQEFATFFTDNECFTISDLATWADMAFLELELVQENTGDTSLINYYSDKVRAGCSGCSDQEKLTITKFNGLLFANSVVKK